MKNANKEIITTVELSTKEIINLMDAIAFLVEKGEISMIMARECVNLYEKLSDAKKKAYRDDEESQ